MFKLKKLFRNCIQRVVAIFIAVHSLEQSGEENEAAWRTRPYIGEKIAGSLNEVNTGRWHEFTFDAEIKEDNTSDCAIPSSTRDLISLIKRSNCARWICNAAGSPRVKRLWRAKKWQPLFGIFQIIVTAKL